ncbi:cardiolipin synthase [Vineibacter terrae]|uniref:cardiolipin synthase n=1 Tax=Vineibacter terrae TaxID=2586908 RepID=UPI001C497E13|nr:cardiolipin synthase [Vineibacter terrae]
MTLIDPGSGGFWAVVYIISAWAICIGALIVVPFRRSPEAAKGWLLLFFVAPWPALLLYQAIGRPTHPRWRRQRVAQFQKVFSANASRATGALSPFIVPAPGPAAALARGIGWMPVLSGNAVEFLPDYDGAIDRLVADIDGAQQHVHLLFYIFADDTTGRRVMAALERAQGRGVTCRVLIDAIGSRRWGRAVMARLAAAGIAAHRILPLRLISYATRADLRNHRKIAVIDGRTGYAGSQNIIDAALPNGQVNRELQVRVQGPIVRQLQVVFAADWFLETEEQLADPGLPQPPEPAGTVAIQTLPSGPDLARGSVNDLFIALIAGARERVVITTPYFVPGETLLQAMRAAVLRGVQVDLIVSRRSDAVLVGLAQRSYYADMLACGVRIHLFQPAFLHAKHMSVDDGTVLIGSSNMDMRSFELNAEVSLVLYDRHAAERLRAIEGGYIAEATALDAAAWDARPLPIKVAENVARLMSPLL